MSANVPFRPSLADVIRRALDQRQADMHVALPAEVVRVDLEQGQVDVKPLIAEPIFDEDGNQTSIEIPVITNVPIVWPGANGFRLTFPLRAGGDGKPGDYVLLVFAERSIDLWLSNQGRIDDQPDPRRHALSDAIAIPGIRPFPEAWKNASDSEITIGEEDGDPHPAAWGDVADDDLAQIYSILISHTHLYHPGPLPPAPTDPTFARASWGDGDPTSTQSQTVKILG